MLAKRAMTVEEYLALDAASDERLEFVNGEIVAMSGGSVAHSAIQTNTIVALSTRVRPPCRVHGSDLRILLEETGLYAYPDVSVVCGEPDVTETSPPSVRNPSLIVEVLSESTASYDLAVKAAHYRHRASLQAIVFVDSRARSVVVQTRNADGTWTLRDLVTGSVEIPGMHLSIPLDELYLLSGV